MNMFDKKCFVALAFGLHSKFLKYIDTDWYLNILCTRQLSKHLSQDVVSKISTHI